MVRYEVRYGSTVPVFAFLLHHRRVASGCRKIQRSPPNLATERRARFVLFTAARQLAGCEEISASCRRPLAHLGVSHCSVERTMSRPRVQQPEDRPQQFDGRPGKFNDGDCEQLGRNSMRCLEENGYDRNAAACQPHFKVLVSCSELQRNS